jgi:signal transduction histidine kinase
MMSLRQRIQVAAVSVCGFGIMLSGIAVYVILQISLLGEGDAALRQQARSLAAMIEIERNDGIEVFHTEIQNAWQDVPFIITDDRGTLIARSIAAAHFAVPVLRNAVIQSCRLPGGTDARIGTWILSPVSEEIAAGPGDQSRTPASIHVITARSSEALDRAMRHLACVLAGVTVCAGILCVPIMGWILARALSPLNVLAQRIASLDDSTLSTRLASPIQLRELAPVIDRLNALLGRLNHAFMREKSLNAAIAHELRTPLAGLITTLVVCNGRQRSVTEYRVVVESCQAMAGQLQRLVEGLLLLVALIPASST